MHASPPASNRPSVIAIFAILVASVGVQVFALATFDLQRFDSAFAPTMQLTGLVAVALGVTTLLLELRRQRRGVGALITLALGTAPLVFVFVFFNWRGMQADEQIEACLTGDAPVACRLIGERTAKRGRPEDALLYLRHGCEGGDARACRTFGGQALRYTDLVDANAPMTALDAFVRACDVDDGMGCDRAAHLLRSTDAARSQELYARGCALGYASSCGAVREAP